MNARGIQSLLLSFYILLFFLYLFAPLIMMSMAAFNDVDFPQVVPWEGFTWRWFPALFDDALMIEGFVNSIWIGIGVVCLSVPIGLAAAIVMTQVHRKLQTIYYTVVVSPVLMPGVILGISTLVFWDRLGTIMDADYESFYYSGMFLTIVGQSTFISAYTVLAGKVRMGTQPDLAALAVLIIAVTLIGAVAIEVVQRREQRRELAAKAAAARAEKQAELTSQAVPAE